ncbi:MAG: hypothetical protein MZV70_45960 [Desulfobacterales bacterium]|nr:hypothetical protein [Desulfobacterales bacterium]
MRGRFSSSPISRRPSTASATPICAKGEWDKAIEAYQQIIEDVFYGTPHFALSEHGAGLLPEEGLRPRRRNTFWKR